MEEKKCYLLSFLIGWSITISILHIWYIKVFDQLEEAVLIFNNSKNLINFQIKNIVFEQSR